MKRCPECNSTFPDAAQFCELDGTVLATSEDVPNPILNHRTAVAPNSQSNAKLLIVGVLIGVILGVLVLGYFALTLRTSQENSNTSSSISSAPQPASVPLQPAPREAGNATPDPSVEPSPSPSVEPSPSPQTGGTQVELSNSSPISTAPSAHGSGDRFVIKLDSGVTIEADDAWQTGEGIWYRKQGVVSLLDPKNVKAIQKVSPPAPQPSAAASPSP